MRSNRKRELDFIRAVSIVGVVMIHISASLLDPAIDRWSYGVSLFVNQLSRFCVPAFLMVSGILAFRSYEKSHYSSLLTKRAHDLIVPYVLWSVIGLLMVPSDKSPVYIFLTGKGTFYQLYYIPLLIQMYLLLPLIRHIAFNKRLLTICAFLSVTVLSVFQWLELFKSDVTDISTKMYQPMSFTFFVWLIYFAVGLLIGRHYERFRAYVDSQALWKFVFIFAACTLTMTVDLYVNWRVNTDLNIKLLNFYRPAAMLYAFGAFALLYKIGLNHSSVLMHKLYVNSFGIYLNHVGVIILLKTVTGHYFFSNAILAGVAFLLTMSLSYWMTAAIKETPFAGIFLGVKSHHRHTGFEISHANNLKR